MKKLKNFLKYHKHAWTLLYVLIYVPWFFLLEWAYPADYPGLYVINCPIDNMIPFNEWFVIPYLLWFLYMPAVFLLIFYSSKKEFYRMSAYEFTGMTVCLLIYTLFPNAIELRLEEISRSNILVDITNIIYVADTSTNVCPSIHVFATFAAHISLVKNQYLKKFKWRKYIIIGSGILSVFIYLSTLFLKQHSIVDLIAGVILGIVLYFVVYKWWFKEKTV